MKPSYLEEIPFSGRPERVLLCTHGLNQNPNALKPLLCDLSQKKIKTYLLHLPGHDGDDRFSMLSAANYLNAHDVSYRFLRERHSQPLGFLGYSFGGLIGFHQIETSRFEKMVLLAPALELRPYTLMIKPFLPYLSRITSIRLGSDEFEAQYRYHRDGVPSQVYSSFFTIYGDSKKTLHAKELPKTLVMMHPRDELVHYGKVKKWSESQPHCQFVTLNNRGASFRRYNHLCFDRLTLGEVSYKQLVDQITGFL